MTTVYSPKSAKIYQFPRKALAAGGRREADRPAADLGSERTLEIQYGGSWYHEAAVQEAERTRKS